MCCNKAILYDRLRHSAMFNLSLSSKELFHSNFLYWISEINKDAFKRLIEILTGEQNLSWGNNWCVRREYNKFDLSVTDENDNFLFVLENKVKSIPLLSQLRGYGSKLPKPDVCKRLLLSLVSEFPDKDKIKNSGWIIKNYEDLSIALSQIRCMISWHYIPYFDDYISFISDFSELVAIWENESSSLNSIFLQDADAICQQLRIHDIYEKCRFACYAQQLNEKLKKSGLLVGKRWDVNQSYSRSSAILELIIYLNQNNNSDKESFVVQIQGNQYRHAIVLKSNGSIPSQQQNISKITSNKYWTNFMNPGGGSGCFPTIFTNSSQKNPYCKFSIKSGFDFIYEYKDIPKTATVSDIFNAIMTDMYRIIAAI